MVDKIFFTSFLIIFLCWIGIMMDFKMKDKHDEIMDTIEEKRELIELRDKIKLRETSIWLDSMDIVINKRLNEYK
jgi:hypothetical protein